MLIFFRKTLLLLRLVCLRPHSAGHHRQRRPGLSEHPYQKPQTIYKEGVATNNSKTYAVWGNKADAAEARSITVRGGVAAM
jgi:hypothetical protein